MNAVIQPKLQELGADGCYLKRLTCLEITNQLLTMDTKPELFNQVLPIVMGLAKDTVPNVLFNCAITYTKMQPYFHDGRLPASEKAKVEKCLEQLKQSDDDDVKYYTQEACK